MKHLKNLLCVALVSLIVGCKTSSPSLTPENIVTSHYNKYVQLDKNNGGDNENIAAILKVFVTDMIETPSGTWSNVQFRADFYLNGLKTNTISKNYTILATEGEIKITDSLIGDSIKYHRIQDALSLMAGELISDYTATPFIWRINNYEYVNP